MEDTPPGLTIIPSEGKGKGKERTPAQKEAIQKALARLAEKRKLKASQPAQVTEAPPKDAPPVIKAKRVYKKRTAPAPSAPSAPSGFPTLPTIGGPSLPAPPPIVSPMPGPGPGPAPDYMGELQQLKQMIGAMANGGREIVRSTKAPKKRIIVVDDSSTEGEEEIVVRRKKSPKATTASTAVATAPAPVPAPMAAAPPAKKYGLDPALFSRH